MPADYPTPRSSNQLPKAELPIPHAIIEDFLGLGLAYSKWKAEVENRGGVWYPGLKAIIIKKEWEMFREEIQRLSLEPNINRSWTSKSNSLVSIIKRLKGEPWADSRPDERDERFRTHRLLSKDAKDRCLQNYVHDWNKNASLSACKSSVPDNMVTLNSETDEIPSQPTKLVSVVSEAVSHTCSLATTQSFDHLAKGNSRDDDFGMDFLLANYDYSSQDSYSINSPSSTQNVATGNLNHVSTSQSILPITDAILHGGIAEAQNPEVLIRATPTFSHDTAMASFDQLPVGENDVPGSVSFSNMTFDSPEADPVVLDWMATHPVSEENIQRPDAEEPCSDLPLMLSVYDRRDSVDMSMFLVLGDTVAPTTATTIADLAKPQILNEGHSTASIYSTSSHHSSAFSRKRRRQDTTDLTSNIPGYNHTNISSVANYVASASDNIMADYETSSQYSTTLTSQDLRTQSISTSEPLPSPLSIYPRLSPELDYTYVRAQIALEQELKRTKDELESVNKRNQKELKTLSQEKQAAEAEVEALQRQVLELRASNEYYEGQTRELISQVVILKEHARQKLVSAMPSNGPKENENNMKPMSSPSSKVLRPLSLSLRPASTTNGWQQPRKLSTCTTASQSSSMLQPAAAAAGSSRPGSAESHVLKTVNVDHETSSFRSGSPRSSTSSPPASRTAKFNERAKTPDSTDIPNPPAFHRPVFRDSSPKQNWMRKISNPFMRKQYREDNGKPAPALPPLPNSAPTLPFLGRTVPLQRQMSGVLIDDDKRMTKDSGYDSLQFETQSRPSMANSER